MSKEWNPADESIQIIDANLFPPSFPFPLIDALIRGNSSLEDTTKKTNEAGSEAVVASNKNEEQDIRLDANEDDIDELQKDLEAHVTSNSEHGVKGSNVGTEDYATISDGGVVFLAASISNLTQYSVPSAPATYNQVEEQAFRDSLQLAVNGIIDKVNEIVQGQKNAKQMDSGTP